jgi:hypothetical protein
MNLKESSDSLRVRPRRLAVLLLGLSSGVPLRTVGDGGLHSGERTSSIGLDSGSTL